MIKLRGHHLLCLVGYRGMGYSDEYVENMTKVHKTIRENPETMIEIIRGPDQLCEKFPCTGDYHCENKSIYKMDKRILDKLQLQIGETISWKEVENRIRSYVFPDDLNTLCEDCSWLEYGVCKEGIQQIRD